VRGIVDNQTVPIARPDIVASMGETTLESAAVRWASAVDLTSISGLADKDTIGITLDDGTIFWVFIDGTPTASATPLGDVLPKAAAAGNTVYLPSINNETFVTATTITASGL